MQYKNLTAGFLSIVGVSFGVQMGANAAIEEILVTANKKSEDISDVGMSIKAMSAETMKVRRIATLDDLAMSTPGLQFAPSTSNTPIFTLRGIGFNESSLGNYPAVSVYLDEAPLAFPVLGVHSAYDLERVEVLKGPQGTLFGQNSTGGAINYIAAKPTDELSAGVDIGYGRFNLMEMEGHVSGPLTDTLKARLSFDSQKMDDWQKSVSRGDENGEEDFFAARLLFEWDPTDSVAVSLNINGWTDKSDPQAMAMAAKPVNYPADAYDEVLNAQFPARDPRAADWGDIFPPKSDREFLQGVIRADIDLSDKLVLTSLTSYIDFDQTQTTDGDGSSAISYDLSDNDGQIETFSQEIRIASDNEEFIDWVAGVNYENSKVDEYALLNYTHNSSSNAANNFIHASGISASSSYENFAVFGNVDVLLSPDMTLKIGARHTKSKISNELCGFDAGGSDPDPNATDPGVGNLANLFTLLGGLFNGDASNPPHVVGFYPDCFTLSYDNVPGEPYKNTLEESNLSWRTGLDYRLNDDVLLYGNVSKGYKAGSYPTVSAATWLQYEPVSQESVLAFEAGVKAQLFDRQLSVNSALFKYRYEDKQIKGKVQDPIFGPLDLLRNVPKSEIVGLEMEVTAAPNAVEGLTLALGTVYLDSEIRKSPDNAVNVFGLPADFKGEAIPYTSEWQVNFNADYSWEVGGLTAFVGMTANYSSDTESQLGGASTVIPPDPTHTYVDGGERPYAIDEYTTFDLRAGISAADEKWRLMAWGKNVTDEYYWTNIIPASDITGRFVAKPATYGLSLNYNF